MKIYKWILSLLMIISMSDAPAKSLKGQKFDFFCQDTQFKKPFVDVDKIISKPVKCRYVHGGFDDGTRFSFYFPIDKKSFTNRFFQYITPFPDSETAAQNYYAASPIGFSIDHGAYFVETNQGGKVDFSDPSTHKEASIGAYRANAACAEFSRHVAKLIYSCDRPYGYCFGGSGGAYRTTGAMESTVGIWDGAVPFVLGSPQAIPNLFAVRMNALRVLRDKMDDIVDALKPGGSGDPYATLNAEQRQVLQEISNMGFPIKSWYGWRYMDAHGFLVLYRTIKAMDPTYFKEDFWYKPGYLGYDYPSSLQRDHVQTKSVIKRIIGQKEAETLNLVTPISESDRSSADRAWASMGSEIKEKPVAYEIGSEIELNTLGGELLIRSGRAVGQSLQITGTKGHFVLLASVNQPQLLTLLQEGDSIQVDNSDWLAVETYYRHQVPTQDYYVWNQFRSYNNQPIYPQRPMLLGPMFTRGAAGCLPNGKIHGKMILCCSIWDREAFAWQGDWYRKKVEAHLGATTDDNFRLWYTDRATHGGEDDPTEVVDYTTTIYQALLDLSDWVEKGIAPSHTTTYQVKKGQVLLATDGKSRGGIQPTPYVTINGKECVNIKPGESATIHVAVDVPSNTGKVVHATWSLDENKQFTNTVNMSKAIYSANGEHVEFDTVISYDKPGTYFPTVKVYAERNGNATTPYTCITNLGKVRVVVQE